VNAPRSVFYYVNLRREGLIPDTEKARQWAVKKQSATHFDRFSFHHLNLNKTPGDYKVGDFYCTISAKNPQAITNKDMFNFIIYLLQSSFRLDGVAPCRLIYLGRHKLGLTIPATAFGIDHGGEILPHLYQAAFEKMSAWAANLWPGYFDIQMSGHVDAENKLLWADTYAVPFLLGETDSASEFFLINLSREPRVAPVAAWAQIAKWDQKIDQKILLELTGAANYAWRQEQLAGRVKKPIWRQPEQLMRLSDPLFGASACSPEHVFSAVKCARKLVAAICKKRILEFGRRDACIAVGERLNGEPLTGKSGNGGGVADALRILVAHDYIRECPPTPTDYFSKPPSPWYVVNPSIYSI